MATFEYMTEWQPTGQNITKVSNVVTHICKEFNSVDEALAHIEKNLSLWNDERIWAYKFGDELNLLHMENNKAEKEQYLKLHDWI